MNKVVIVAAKRTPIGSFLGCLAPLSATDLGAAAIKACLGSTIPASLIDETIMGCVLPAGLGQAPARQATLKAGLSQHCAATTVNKVCGSGMKALMLARDAILAGSIDSAICGGMESMSNAPYLLQKARAGYRIAHNTMYDHMMLDGLENAYDGKAMGCFAQSMADSEGISREAMDQFALSSLTRAITAQKQNFFSAEITPLTISTRKGDIVIDLDEGPQTAKPEKIPQLKPAFADNGSVTAANSSSISDGAAALFVCSQSFADQHSLKPLATIVGHSTHAMAPEEFTIAPIPAIEKLLHQCAWNLDDVDAFEINEAFAMVTMLAIKKLGLSTDKVNMHGGACALGHPIGASGARIIVSLLHILQRYNLKRGIASLCIGGGEACAVAIERF